MKVFASETSVQVVYDAMRLVGVDAYTDLTPIAGIMQRKVALQGSLPIVVRFIKSAEALVDAATRVPTRFLDEGK